MKALATLALFGVVFTHEDNEFSFLSNLLKHKKKNKNPVPEPVAENNFNEDNEFMTLPYVIRKPYFPPPVFSDPILSDPYRKTIYADDELFRSKEEKITLESFLMDVLALAEEMDKRDQLIHDVMEVARDVVPFDEADDQELFLNTADLVDESLEINAFLKDHNML